MTKFENCPFCDSGNVSLDREYDCDSGGTFYSVKCNDCRSSSGSSFAGKGDDCPNFYAGIANGWNSQSVRDQLSSANLNGLRLMNSSITNLTMDNGILIRKNKDLVELNKELVEALGSCANTLSNQGCVPQTLIELEYLFDKAKELNK